MFGLPEAPKLDFNKMAAQEKAHRKADWIEKAALMWFRAGKESFRASYFGDIYDDIQKFRNIESA